MDIRLFTIYLANFLINLLFAVMAPFYPLEALDKGLEQWQIGFIFCFMPLTTFVVSPILGKNMKKLGRRRTFTVGNFLSVHSTQSLSMLSIGLSIWSEANLFFAIGICARLLSGLGYACICTVSIDHSGFALAQSDYTDSMNEVLGMIEFAAGLGLMIGPALGSFAFYLVGFKGVFLGLAIIFVLTTPVIYKWLGADRDYKESGNDGQSLNLYTNPRLVINAMAMGYSMALISFFDTAIAPHLSAYGVSQITIGLLLAGTDCAYTLTSFVLSRVLKYLPLVWVLALGLLVASIAYYLMGPWEVFLPPKLPIVILGIVFLSMGLGIIVVVTLPNLVKVATVVLGLENDDSLADGLSSTIYAGMLATYMSLGEVVGPIIGGFFVDQYGFPDGAALMGGAGFALLILFIISERNRRDDVAPLPVEEEE